MYPVAKQAGGVAGCPPDTSHQEVSTNLLEKRGKETRENGEEKNENRKKGRWKIENGRRKSDKMKRGPFLLFTFQNHLNLFWVYQMRIFYREKSFHAGKISGKMTLPPFKNIPLMPLVVPITGQTEQDSKKKKKLKK